MTAARRSTTNILGWLITVTIGTLLAVGAPALRAADKKGTPGLSAGGQQNGQPRNHSDWLLLIIAQMIVEDFLANGGDLEDLPALLDEITQWYQNLMRGKTGGGKTSSGTAGGGTTTGRTTTTGGTSQDVPSGFIPKTGKSSSTRSGGQ
jgi:hypothetical protein